MRIPDDFVVKSRFHSIGERWLRGLGLLIIIATVKVLSMLEIFDLKLNSPMRWVTLVIALICIVVINTLIHERIHHYVFRKYGLKTKVHFAYNTLPIGEGCPRNGAINAIISPLIVLEVLGLAIFVLLWESDFIAYATLFLLANVGLSFSDIEQFVWLRKHPKNYWFGRDKKEGFVMYDPQSASNQCSMD